LEYKTLLFEIRDHVGWLTLNRPDRGNAVSLEIVDELRRFFADLEKNLDIRIVVMRGAGKHFCTGLDLMSSFGAGQSEINPAAGLAPTRFDPRGCRIQWDFNDITIKMRQAPQPIVACMRGTALGGGLGIALACDIRLAGAAAKFGQPEVNLGVIPGYAATQRLPRLVGMGNALYLLLSGEMIGAEEALRMGLVQKVVPPEELLAAAQGLAKTIASKGPKAVKAAKLVARRSALLDFESGCALESEKFGSLFENEAAEGMKAFLEKRPPSWQD
jgi:enoyl-CoA hydratase